MNKRVEGRFSAYQWDGTAEGATPIIDWILHNGETARYHEARHARVVDGIRVEIPQPARIVVENTNDKAQHLYPHNWVVLTTEGFVVTSPSEIDTVLLYLL